MTPARLSAALCAALFLVVAAACSSATQQASGSSCADLDACCSSLPATTSGVCKQQAASAEGLTDKATACSTLLNGYKSDGLCTGGAGGSSSPTGPGGGTSSADGGAGGKADAGGQPAVCARYLDCVAAATPSLAASSIAQYGPAGTCWSSGSQLASTCLTACTTGLADLQQADPASCPLCLGASECSAPTPACAGGKCVECASDTDCKTSTATRCDTGTHACVGYTANGQCASHLCQPGGTCCVAMTCDASQFNCGAVDDGCGAKAPCQYSICPVGACVSNRCSTAGTACTVGTTGTCASGEKCMYDAWHQAYLCAPTSPDHMKCTSSGGVDTCEDGYTVVDHTPLEPYFCDLSSNGVNGVCIQYCLATSECPTGATCKPEPGQTTISATMPGECL